MADYDELVVNGIGGTLNEPCAGTTTFLVCSYASTAAWAAAADRMFRRLRRRWNAVASVADVPAAVTAQVTSVENDYANLVPPRPWRSPATQASESAAIAAWMSSAAAALRALDMVPGAPAPPVVETVAAPPPSGGGWVLGVLGGLFMLIILGAVGVAAWLFSRQ